MGHWHRTDSIGMFQMEVNPNVLWTPSALPLVPVDPALRGSMIALLGLFGHSDAPRPPEIPRRGDKCGDGTWALRARC